MSLSGGQTKTGLGNVYLNGNTEVATNKSFQFAPGVGNFDMSLSGGQLKTGYGGVLLNGNIEVAEGTGNFDMSLSSGQFKTGAGTVTLNGETEVAANKSLTVKNATPARGDTTLTSDTLKLGASSGNVANIGISDTHTGSTVDLRISSKGTGAISLNGRTEIASGYNFTHLGSGNFISATGAIQLNGDTTVAATRKLTLGSALVLGATGGSSRVALQNTTAGSSTAFVSGTLNSNGSILLAGASSGLGFTTGAGGSVTQDTSKSTAVELNFPTGTITMHNQSLNANSSIQFPFSNSRMTTNDMILLQHNSGGTIGAYIILASPISGGATITVRNISAGPLAEAIVLRFVVIKSPA